jgi:hypothetical protein
MRERICAAESSEAGSGLGCCGHAPPMRERMDGIESPAWGVDSRQFCGGRRRGQWAEGIRSEGSPMNLLNAERAGPASVSTCAQLLYITQGRARRTMSPGERPESWFLGICPRGMAECRRALNNAAFDFRIYRNAESIGTRLRESFAGATVKDEPDLGRTTCFRRFLRKNGAPSPGAVFFIVSNDRFLLKPRGPKKERWNRAAAGFSKGTQPGRRHCPPPVGVNRAG